MSDIKKLMSLTPESLAEEQHVTLRDAVVKYIQEFANDIKREHYSKALSKLAFSPAGDCLGCENEYLDFSWAMEEPYGGNGVDVGDVLNRLEELKKIVTKGK